MTALRYATLFALMLVASVVCAKESKKDKDKDKDKEAQIAWQERVVPGAAVTIRLKRAEGKFLIYEGTLERTQNSHNSYVEKNDFYLNVLCAEQREENINGNPRTLDMMAIQRTYTNRERTETLQNGKTINRALENSADLITLGPNYELVGQLRCYGFDAQNCAAFRTEQLLVRKDGLQMHGRVLQENNDAVVFLTAEDKVDVPRKQIASLDTIPQPHVIINETQHYLFPIFSQRKVSPGDTWKFKVPVIIPIEQGTPPRLVATQFTAAMTGRLREVRQKGGGTTAIVDYQVTGLFDSDSDDYRDRFPENFSETAHIIHKMSGQGVVSVDVEKGRILEKSESFDFVLYAKASVVEAVDKPAKVTENRAEITSRFNIRLMMPGEKLKNGKQIPPYE
jgi:hypothetical protein